jgi:ubiquinol-cytochrome c reductase cytochrome c1 subunit
MLRKAFVLAAATGLAAGAPAIAATSQAPLKHVAWSFSGPFGQYDQAQLQRGFKVYHDVCAQCHALNYTNFYNLGERGGPFWSPKYENANDNPYVKAIAAEYKVMDVDPDSGDTKPRTATTADHIPAPYPNDIAAKATLGGAPPDLSMVEKAREGGADYIYSLVVGYPAAPPAGVDVPAGKFYNPYFPGDLSSSLLKGYHGEVPAGGIISMPPPLSDNRVTYDDGTPATLDQEAKDVSAFLTWASDPKMEQRKQTGMAVMIYLVLFSGLLYGSYRRIWRDVAH